MRPVLKLKMNRNPKLTRLQSQENGLGKVRRIDRMHFMEVKEKQPNNLSQQSIMIIKPMLPTLVKPVKAEMPKLDLDSK